MPTQPSLLTKTILPATTLVLITSLLTLTGFLSQFGWLLDLTSHFRLQYLTALLACSFLLLIVKHWKTTLVCWLFIIINLWQILPWYLPVPPRQPLRLHHINRLKILLINLNSRNPDHSQAIRYIQQVNPDILALQEINQDWLSSLSATLTSYPYQQAVPRKDHTGLGIFSQIPLTTTTVEHYGAAQLPTIIAHASFSNQPVTVVLTHPLPPITAQDFRLRNQQLHILALAIKDFQGSLVVLGDLNTTPWSYYFQRFRSTAGLVDSRQGFGLQPSWPSYFPLIRIPIDHALVSPDLTVLDRQIGPDIRSDHLPVFLELAISN